MEYREFLEKKIPIAQMNGLDVSPDELSPVLKPHQRDIVLWAVKGGQRAIFASFGLGKGLCQLEITRLIHKKTGGKTLIVCPLGVRQEFTRDARMIDLELKFIRRNSEMDDEHPYYITNYESIRDGRLDPNDFTAVSLDEASILRSYGSKTYQEFLTLFPSVPYKFVATATPAPNRYKELIHYAGFLGIMQTSQSLTRFFQRDSTKANNLTLYPHKEHEFWMWMHSWAVFLQRPSELGYSDEGYEMPELKVIKHEVAATDEHPIDRDGQIHMFNEPVLNLKNAAREKRESIDIRIAEMKRILEADPENHYIIWHDLESERHAIKKALPEAAIVYGSLDLETREQRVIDFSEGKYQYFASKPEISGSGCNFQHHCHKAIFLGVGYKFNDFIQSVHRIYRYLQSFPCEIHLIYTEAEREVLRVLERKWDEHNQMMGRMSEIVKEYGLNDLGLDGLKQGMLAERKVVKGKLFEVAHNDCVLEARLHEDDSVDEIITSIPFCYDSETEVLTDNGWKGFGDVDISKDRIATYNPDTQCMEYQTASHRVWEHYDGEMIEFTGRAFNLSVTPNHRMYAARTDSENDFKIITAEEIARSYENRETKWKVIVLFQNTPIQTMSKIQDMPQRYQYSGMIGCVTVPNGLIIVRRNGFPCISGNSNHYQYTANYADFGETDNNEHFWAQMDYLTPELLRILKPGRICCIHVKDRILFGNVTGAGAPTVSPFHAEAIFHYKRHGFDYMGMITVITDVVRENNQTYRLGWTEQCKDGTKMGVGSPEYVLLFRKPQTDRTKGYADVPVVKSKEEYSRARWQIDAHAFWRCSGDRLLTAEEWEGYGPDVLAKAFRDTTREKIYDYEAHVAVGEALDEKGKLPSTFMAIAPGSFAEDVWDDVARMKTLNTNQSLKGRELHVCPLPIDIVDRLIERYSNKGELIYDPFAGIMTVPYRAILMGRRGGGSELNEGYFRDGVNYLQRAENDLTAPTLFDAEGLNDGTEAKTA